MLAHLIGTLDQTAYHGIDVMQGKSLTFLPKSNRLLFVVGSIEFLSSPTRAFISKPS